MLVNFEFLGMEPLDNVITSINYNVDKVVFFGYANALASRQKSTKAFLEEFCGVSEVAFVTVPENDLQGILTVMRAAIEKEIKPDNDLFFDVTGGESLILVAFGMLSKEYNAPMHIFNIAENKLIDLDEGSSKHIDELVPKKHFEMTLEKYIKLKGGIINSGMQKTVKHLDDPDFIADVEKVWLISKKYTELWNSFSAFLGKYLIPAEGLSVCKDVMEIRNYMSEAGTAINGPAKLNPILDELAAAGILKNLKHKDGVYAFTYKSEAIKSLISEGGSAFELHVYQQMKHDADYSEVGIHLDWDGVIDGPGKDVLNEIDVLLLKGNIPVFISCKSGKMGSDQTLRALYELHTVTERFGGKYAKMILATVQPVQPGYILRAKEMGIEIMNA